MNTEYSTFNYTSDFHYNYNVFKKNKVGIGTDKPYHDLHVLHNISATGNTDVDGNIIMKNKYPGKINLLEYNINTNIITPLKLGSYESNFNTNKYEWSLNDNKLSLDYFNKRDNTPVYYKSIEYKIDKNATNFSHIYLYSKYDIVLTNVYIYIKDTDNTFKSFQNLDTSASNFKIVLNDTNPPEYTITSVEDYNYKLNTPINLQKNSTTKITITNNITDTEPIYYIIFTGYYLFNKSILWNNTIADPNTIFIHSNIGIGTTNFNSQFHVNNKAYISKSVQSDNILTANGANITNNITNQNLTINSIISDKIIINSNNNKLGIGTTNTNDFFNIADNFIINHNNNTFLNNEIYMNNNISLYENINSISYNNNSLIVFSNNNQNHNIKLNNIHISKLYNNSDTKQGLICFKKKVNINDINDINNTNNISINNLDNIINGDVYINEYLDVKNNINIADFTNLQFPKIKTELFKSTNISKINSYVKSKYIQTKNLDTYYLKIPDAVNNTKNSLYYNKGVFYGNNDKSSLYFISEYSDITINSFSYDYKGTAEFLYTTSKDVKTPHINISEKLIIPKHNKAPEQTTINKAEMGSIQYNMNSLQVEIFNGTKWGSLKYNDSDSELNHLSFNKIHSLNPPFNPRVENYIYDDSDKPTFTTISINPFNSLDIKFKYNNTLVYSTTINNNTKNYINRNISMETFQNANKIVVTSKKINTNLPMTYTCKFNSASLVIDTIELHRYFNLISDSSIINKNDYIIKPSVSTINTVQLQASTILAVDAPPTPNLNSKTLLYYELSNNNNSIITIVNNSLYKNDLNRAYYDKNKDKIYLGKSQPSHTTPIEIINNNENLISGFSKIIPTIFTENKILKTDFSQAYYERSSKRFYLQTINKSANYYINYNNKLFSYNYEGFRCKLKLIY